jgi:PLP dependent protein
VNITAIRSNYMSVTNSISQRIQAIRSEIPAHVRLVAVSKYATIEQMRESYAAGVRDFGESRVPTAIEKQEALADLVDIEWHLIGHLQSNKVRKAVQMFNWIHSVDSLKLCQQIDRVAAEFNQQPKIFLQTKILPDPQKSGWETSQLLRDLAEIDQLKHLQVRGLMTIAPSGLGDQELLNLFCSLVNLQNNISENNYLSNKMQNISMGMSQDYQLAIAAGSDVIRVGSKIFT